MRTEAHAIKILWANKKRVILRNRKHNLETCEYRLNSRNDQSTIGKQPNAATSSKAVRVVKSVMKYGVKRIETAPRA
jgi:hypothetical protein